MRREGSTVRVSGRKKIQGKRALPGEERSGERGFSSKRRKSGRKSMKESTGGPIRLYPGLEGGLSRLRISRGGKS